MSELEIKYDRDGFEKAISIFNEVYDDLVSQKSEFERASQNLVQDWQGKGYTATDREIESILKEFNSVNDGLKVLIKEVSDSLEELDELESEMSKGLETK